jgi:chemotaxis protein methyltransferase CheR
VSEPEAVSDEDFQKVCDFLYRRTGMLFTASKRYYVQRRISDRMSFLKIAFFPTYFAFLRSDVDGEIEKFINAFTVNETYFYREEHQLRCLSSDLLNERVRAKKKGEALRIWSMPCATGEEPYSIAMWLLENWPEVDVQDVEIVGSDIDTECLTAARLGEFGQRALMRLSPALIGKFFATAGKDRWRIVDDVRQSVQFSQANLMDRQETRSHGVFDVIFCRNVLIYFDDASRRVAAENLYESLAPGGFICLGHTESMSRISPLFEVRRFADAIVYQRRTGAANG